ncbi:sodium-coupled monocarboxylate transporter 1-like isoform X2 [Acanthopagrus latus]|uniref:sodium-coupled monocarboxylate transporter 1-like isoform X2 n=1 Tax=Acanthopagrus latus TaxID=8177 RepID=UPI00187C2FC2|nr:sodium-coupled monocarboxylate transporter 1-like isoform X2 [Acanthopagrus latus]
MSGDSQVAGSFVTADYVVFALTLVVSAAVGFYFAWASRGQQSSRDFLTAGRKLTALPVSMSMTTTYMSSITVLSNPAEVYRFGAIFAYLSVSYVLSTVVVSEVFLPIYYRLGINSIYEYLELRFNKATRLLGTVLCILNITLFSGIVIYGPALAFSQIVDLDLWGGIFLTGIVCTLYCTLGGLKAVVWTDVFQLGIMLAGYLAVIIKAVILQGGVPTIISDAQQGGRLNFIDFDINPLRRHTFWTIAFGATFNWIAVNGTNQTMVQRFICCKSITHARVALYINMLGLCTFLTGSVFAGLCLYSVYRDCDPWTAGLISAPDQLMPYLVMDIMTGYPGLPGLFFAAVCSGSLSTVSSSINALAVVTLEDMIKPYTNMSEKHLFWMSKGLSVFYGVICISMAGLASGLGGMMQGGFSSLVSGLLVSCGLSIASVIYPPSPAMTRPLSLTIDGCNFTTTDSLNWTSTALPTQPTFITATTATLQPLQADYWQAPSYLYIGIIGAATSVIVGLIVTLLTGGLGTRVESRLTLLKEDTTLYHIFTFIKDRVMRRAGKQDLMEYGEEKAGNTNPSFFDTNL